MILAQSRLHYCTRGKTQLKPFIQRIFICCGQSSEVALFELQDGFPLHGQQTWYLCSFPYLPENLLQGCFELLQYGKAVVWQEMQTMVFICKCLDMRHNADMLVEFIEFTASICFPFNSILLGYHQLVICDFKLAQLFHYMLKVEDFAKFLYWDRDNFVESRCKTHSKFLA